MDEVAADTMAIIAKRVPPDKRNLSMTDRLILPQYSNEVTRR
jgi:hypothetical protein